MSLNHSSNSSLFTLHSYQLLGHKTIYVHVWIYLHSCSMPVPSICILSFLMSCVISHIYVETETRNQCYSSPVMYTSSVAIIYVTSPTMLNVYLHFSRFLSNYLAWWLSHTVCNVKIVGDIRVSRRLSTSSTFSSFTQPQLLRHLALSYFQEDASIR